MTRERRQALVYWFAMSQLPLALSFFYFTFTNLIIVIRSSDGEGGLECNLT